MSEIVSIGDNCMNLCMIGELGFMLGLGMSTCGLCCDWCIVFMENDFYLERT